jgi:hypothetical protein
VSAARAQRCMLAVLLAALAGATSRVQAQSADAPQARARLSATRVFVHEQTVLEVLVDHPVRAEPRWETPPFEGLWPEQLPTDGTPMFYRGAVAERTTRFRRALFPTRAGEIEIRPSRVWLRDAQGNERAVVVPGVLLQAEPLPPPDAGAAAAALVGELSVRIAVSADHASAGRAIPLRIDVFGDANVWDLTPPDVQAWFGSAAEVFPGRTDLSTDDHDGRLSTRRSFAFDIVPSRAGVLEIPAYELSYFDPRSRSYRIARAEAHRVAIAAAERDPLPARTAPATAGPAADPASTGDPWRWLGVSAALLAGAAALAALYLRSPRRLPASADGGSASAVDPQRLLADALRESASAPLAQGLARAVRAALSLRHGVDAAPLTSAEVSRQLHDAEAAALLAALERVRFRGENADRDALISAVRQYLSRI